MKRMKSAFSLLVIVSMVLSLASCGKTDSEPDKELDPDRYYYNGISLLIPKETVITGDKVLSQLLSIKEEEEAVRLLPNDYPAHIDQICIFSVTDNIVSYSAKEIQYDYLKSSYGVEGFDVVDFDLERDKFMDVDRAVISFKAVGSEDRVKGIVVEITSIVLFIKEKGIHIEFYKYSDYYSDVFKTVMDSIRVE